MQLRSRLLELVTNDLLGPAGGENEEVAERNVRDRYLVGVLAPQKRKKADPNEQKRGTPNDDDESDEEVPAIPDELAEGGDDSPDDGTTDKDVSLTQTFLPSSIGLTFCVGKAATKINVEANWGQYLREVKEDQINPKTGKPVRVWRRFPRGGKVELNLREGNIPPKPLDSESPDVEIRGRIRKRDHGFVVTLFLVNGQEEGTPKDASYVFQPLLKVTAPGGGAIFEKKQLEKVWSGVSDPAIRDEEERMDMLYRRQVEFAVGHGVSVHATPSPDTPDRAISVETRIVPVSEVWKSTPPRESDESLHPVFGKLKGLTLDMKDLSRLEAAGFKKKLAPLVTVYRAWIEAETAKIAESTEGLSKFKNTAEASLADAKSTLRRIEEGLALIEKDEKAAEAFRFMNEAMWLQRTHSLYSEERRRGKDPNFDRDVDVPQNRTWYPFQLAFILLNLPGITKLDHRDRSEAQDAVADLLFFPTGGGKTEAYLGLAAYTMGIRRLHGTIAGRDGEHGVAVLMRYTLRLLTIQQFQRATALICACESIRRSALEKGDVKWGKNPFRIGLWVGQKTTPNYTDDAEEAVKQLKGSEAGWAGSGAGSPYQLTACPWCGSRIDPGKHLEVKPFAGSSGRTLTYCGDVMGQCRFSRRGAPGEGLPILVVDEEIYRLLPSMLIATVDKFAQMPWKGPVQMLFGQVDGKCERHGFRSPEVEDAGSHPKTKDGLPSAKTVPQNPLRPPDLIIQDELHLISGPLGTLVGLYETAIDRLCTWEVNGKRVRPKVVASTATIQRAGDQVGKLFLRRVAVFPPQGLDIRNNFFSLQREPSEEFPGRLYIGICAPGRRLKAALIRVYVAFLCAAQTLYEKHEERVDPWMTLVGYFNSMRELGGMRRLVDDDVAARAKKMDRRGLAKRQITPQDLAELTSRMRSDDIPRILDQLEAVFDPKIEAKRKELIAKGDFKSAPKKPLDVLLATNMISVGVDVPRLGLMVVCGQPKATAEYIQATSRVGRKKPGIVCTVYNWGRPRDLSHYETFEHYHSTFYKHVEALSVTPFSTGAIRRGLAGVLVSLVRLKGTEFNPNNAAGKLQSTDGAIEDAIETIAKRAELVYRKEAGDACRAELHHKMDLWRAQAQNKSGGRILTYDTGRGSDKGVSVPLLSRPSLERWEEFTCLNSLREVEPTVKLILQDGGLDEDACGGTSQPKSSDSTGEPT